MTSINRNLCIVPLLRGSSFPWSRGYSPGAQVLCVQVGVVVTRHAAHGMVPVTYLPCLYRPLFSTTSSRFPSFCPDVFAFVRVLRTVLLHVPILTLTLTSSRFPSFVRVLRTVLLHVPILAVAHWMPLHYSEGYSRSFLCMR